MATSTKIRPLARLIDQSANPLWAIGPDGRLVYLSAGLGEWLGVEPEALVGRLSVAGASISDDPLDFLAASLAAPPGTMERGAASLLVQPKYPGRKTRHIAPRDTRFVRLGDGHDEFVLAMTGEFADATSLPEIEAAIQLRQQLDHWRLHHEPIANVVTTGVSRAAVRIQTQVRLACRVRSDLLMTSPPGGFPETIARSIHQKSSPGEPLIVINGSLMDPELLDASLGASLARLDESADFKASLLIESIDEMPVEAQTHLAGRLDEYSGRLRLIAIASQRLRVVDEATEPPMESLEPSFVQPPPIGLIESITDRLCGLQIQLVPLASRVEDIALLATAMLDRRRASGDGNADRFQSATLDRLTIYPWPENHRELDSAIRHALRKCDGPAITPEDLPLAIRSYRPNQSMPIEQQSIDLDETIAQYESELIRQTLDACDGNRAEAARRLNISRARLLRKLESLPK